MTDHAHHPGILLPQDTNFDNADQPGIAQPYSQAEIEDLLYGGDRSAGERLARLRELRDESAIRESGDLGNQDPAAMLDELDRAIDELSATMANAEDSDDYADRAAPYERDPDSRLDALAPDDVDARAAILGEDADAGDDPAPIDATEWDDGDDFDPEQGVR